MNIEVHERAGRFVVTYDGEDCLDYTRRDEAEAEAARLRKEADDHDKVKSGLRAFTTQMVAETGLPRQQIVEWIDLMILDLEKEE